jgi:hypothetical protein
LVSLPTLVREYELRNLSAGGALLSGTPLLETETMVDLILRLPGLPVMRVEAEVIRHVAGIDGTSMALVFHHETDVVEDQIQGALLAELEAAASPVAQA